MRAHRLKIWPDQFAAARSGLKVHELRKADRDFQPGDLLLLQEFDHATGALTGDSLGRTITYIARPEDNPQGLKDGFVVMSVAKAEPQHTAAMRNNSAYVEWIEPPPKDYTIHAGSIRADL
jgi:hypothetical protein